MNDKKANDIDALVEYNERPMEFKEKTWGKEEEGEFILDGVVFRGKQAFSKALEGLKTVFRKGSQKEIKGIKFKALDVRKKGAGLEIEVEMIDQGNRGIANLKLYGPNKKKENVVTVTKSKESDNKYVVILAEKIIKPLMMGLLSGVDQSEVFSECVNIEEKKNCKIKDDSLFRCPHCDKTSYSSPGLKGHITKMHKEIKENPDRMMKEGNLINTESDIKTPKKDDLYKEANKVVNLLLTEIIEISDDEDTLEEICDVTTETMEKKYTKKCENCDYEVEATKRYVAIQILSKHKETCVKKASKLSKTINCDECDLEVMDKQKMKRHKRDEHGVVSGSTSPPMKKKRRQSSDNDNIGEPMNVDIQSECENGKVEDLSLKLEEMEIDMEIDRNDHNEEEKKLKERSNSMDEKIKVREQRITSEEIAAENKKKETEKKKSLKEKEAIERKREEIKLRKQKKKNIKKKSNKLNAEIIEDKNSEDIVFNIPNIRNIPGNCKHLVNKDDVLYVVPGNGCCGPNCAAACLFQDEVFGSKLRRSMNIFFANHWHDRYQFLTQCSPGSPFVRKLRGGEIQFTDPVELINFLKKSDDAAFMWSDSEDLAIIADMYQIKIKIITTKGIMDRNPTVNWIYPDKDMEKFAELRNVDLDEMVIIHEDDLHFNLVVSINSDLATMGSLSYRFNIGPIVNKTNLDNDDKISSRTETEMNEESGMPNTVKELQMQLKKCEKSKRMIKNEYVKCETELRIKTEEAEKLKIEIKDLKQIVGLGEKLRENNLKISPPEERSDEEISDDEENIFEMRKSGFGREGPQTENLINKDQEFNCEECDYQGTRKMELKKHINLKHTMKDTYMEGTLKCRNCGEQFSAKWNLMQHRKSMHLNSVAYCRNKIEGNCVFSDDICWWNHAKKVVEENVKCYICNETFDCKAHMMNHRKKQHPSVVRVCNEYKKNNCRFVNESCWYTHESVNKNHEHINEADNSVNEPVFRKASENLEPSIVNKEEQLKEKNQK